MTKYSIFFGISQHQKLNCRAFGLDWFFKRDCGLQQYALSYFQLYFDFNLYLFITMNREGKTKKWGRGSKMCFFFVFFILSSQNDAANIFALYIYSYIHMFNRVESWSSCSLVGFIYSFLFNKGEELTNFTHEYRYSLFQAVIFQDDLHVLRNVFWTCGESLY